MFPAREFSTRALVFAVALAVSAGPVAACSTRGTWVSGGTTALRFMATFLPDTVLAGPGALKPGNALGHFGRGDRRTIYGQLAMLGEVPSRTARVLPEAARTVVLVPWDYAADCSLVPWNRSAVWLTPGQEGLLSAALRPQEHWVDGMPTFDIFRPERQPYDPSNEELGGSDSIAMTALPPQRLMHLLDSLPSASTDTLVLRRVFDRLHGDATLRDRYPVMTLISAAVSGIETARMEGIRPPFAGTLKLELSFEGGPWRTLWARTDPSPTHLNGERWADDVEPTDPLTPRLYDGYTLYLHTSAERISLPHHCMERGRTGYGYVNVPRHAADAHLSPGRWSIGFEESMIENVFTADDRARADSQRDLKARLNDVRIRRDTSEWTPRYGLHVERSRRGGAATFSGSMTFEGHGRIRVRGAQVDTLTVSC